MRVEPFAQPNKRLRLGTIWVGGTIDTPRFAARASATALFLTAMAATLTIGFRESRLEYAYEFVVFILAAGWCLLGSRQLAPPVPAFALAAIAAWGFLQLALGATVYRFQTMEGSLRFTALAATAWISFHTFRWPELRVPFLNAIAWLGVLVAITSVLAYFMSPAKILWIFDAPYPDVWGPFLSRNNFAQFLELAMPVALWLALKEPAGNFLYLSFAAIMLASGLASASRAGSVILVLEALAALWLRRKSPRARRMAMGLVFSTILFSSVPGIGTLVGRMTSADPYQGRREIAHATLEMISSRPWTGFGLGTFPAVYPAYALFDEGHSVEHAHNDWLEWAAEGGVVFALVWMVLALWTARPAVRSVWGIGVLGSFLHCAVDYPFARFGISAWTLIIIGILAATEVREVRHRLH